MDSMRLMPGRQLSPAVMLVTAFLIMVAGFAHAQQIIVVVNGEPITALDIEQRSKNSTNCRPIRCLRQEVLEELITEILKVKEAKRWGLEVSNAEVDTAFGTMANRMRMTTDQLTQVLAKAGVNATTLKHRIRADIAWPQLVRGRYQTSLQVAEKDILTAATDAKGEEVSGTTIPCGLSCFSSPLAPRRPSLKRVSAMRKPCAAASRAASKVSGLRVRSGMSPSATRSSAAPPTSAGVAQDIGWH